MMNRNEITNHCKLYEAVYKDVFFFDDEGNECTLDVLAIRNNTNVTIYQIGGSIDTLLKHKEIFQERIAEKVQGACTVNALYIDDGVRRVTFKNKDHNHMLQRHT